MEYRKNRKKGTRKEGTSRSMQTMDNTSKKDESRKKPPQK